MQSVLVFALALVAAVCAQEVEDGVVVGTDATFDAVIKGTEFVLVEFYAPWCGHCKQLAPEYAKAAQALADLPNVKLVKLDATIHQESASQFEIQGYPTLKFFKNGVASEFTGGRSAGEIEAWVRKASGPASTLAASADAVNSLIKNNEFVVVGAFASASSAEFQAFIDAAGRASFPFTHTFDAAIAEALGAAIPSVTAHKKFDDGKVVYSGAWDASELATFALANSLPLLIEFSEENAERVFGGDIKKHLLVFVGASHENLATIKSELTAAAASARGQMLFVWIDTDIEDNGRILEFFDLTTDDTPAIRIIDLENNMAKYHFNGDITAATVNPFVTSFLAGELQPTLKSAELPEDWNAASVKVLVGSNFKEVALDDNKHVFVEFYAPWCGHCKQLQPIWDELGEHFKDHPDVIIAKLDSTANELTEVSIQSYPTLMLFKKGAKSTPLEYEGERDIEALIQYVETEIDREEFAAGHDEF